MRSFTWLRLRWPADVEAAQVEAALRALHGLSTPHRSGALVALALGTRLGVEHFLAVPERRSTAVIHQLRQAIPGLLIEPNDQPGVLWSANRWEVWMSTRRRPLRGATPEATAAGLLAALSAVRDDEVIGLAWTLGPVRHPIAVPTKAAVGHGEVFGGVVSELLWPGRQLDTDARTALVQKQGEAGWRAAGRLLVKAQGVPRQLQLLQGLAGALRAVQKAGAEIGAHRLVVFKQIYWPLRRPLALNVPELLGLLAWPIGNQGTAVVRTPARVLPLPRGVPDQGRVIGVGAYPGQQRPVALSVKDSLSHTWAIGPTGAGKTTLLAGLARQDVAAGRGVLVIDPKGDLVSAVLAGIPAHRLDDVVVLDLAHDTKPVGFNPLAGARSDPELAADRLLTLFRSLSGEAWGPRIEECLFAGLLAVAVQPQPNLCLLPLLLSDSRYRARALEHISDPFGARQYWQLFDRLSPNEREQTIAPVLRRLRPMLLRPRLRAVIGQSDPKLDLAELFTKRRVVLVSSAGGQVGPAGAALFSSLVLAQVWQLAQARTTVPAEHRHPVMVFIDEVQEAVHGITDVADMLARSRSLGVGLHLAHQNLAQLDPRLRSALAANARSKLVWQTSAEDASFFARGQVAPRPEDLQRLPRFQAYASLLSDNAVTPFMTINTQPLPTGISDPDDVRHQSAERYGTDRALVEADLKRLLEPTSEVDERTIGQRRRST